jgi:hypothetical protein
MKRRIAAELALADEALCWPLTYLADAPLRADAVATWAKAKRRSLRLLLGRRSERAWQKAAWAGCRPHEVEPRILSDSSLRRYLGPGLETLAARLATAGVPVR